MNFNEITVKDVLEKALGKKAAAQFEHDVNQALDEGLTGNALKARISQLWSKYRGKAPLPMTGELQEPIAGLMVFV